jgi:demethylmenaquinone methyltransferase/2-methoxy-6-polyprenyl-1,4-benzoquinol methylase
MCSMSLVIPKNDSPKMFDQIAKRYDLVNRLLSFGQDVFWRQEMKRHLPSKESFDLLDIATGTGDVVLALVKDNPKVHTAYGVDLSEGMLEIGKFKVKAQAQQARITLEKADAQALPFLEGTFDAVTIAFGIRNIPDLRLALLEMYRVLKKDGRVLILEFSLPQNPIVRVGHWIYLNVFVPLIGLIFSGHTSAYRYLAQTIESFPYGDRFCKILRQMGFTNIQSKTFMGGAATLYWADK